ncbi:ABC transporter ATP-binding protein [Rhizobium puerariae]|uniref:ABC transporter ATP-binding protein n=1 Tax=Rhizobium puerariae TaxID=1585791 RepID=A0ABV6AF42_9HYPH
MVSKLSLRNIEKRYGNVIALHPVSLEVEEGEFLTLLGPSGSGKTTILQILAGLIDADGGEMLIGGKPAQHLPAWERDIGLVFQNYALFPHMTIEENLAFPLKMRRRPAAEIARRVQDVLEVVRLPDIALRFPSELSGGQQQRIALARCAIYKPAIILMDEPLGALDKQLRDHMQIEVRRLHRELGATILYVTHDQDEAMAMSDRICLMNGGRIQQLGAPEDMYFSPNSLFSAQFFGISNVLPGTVAAIDGDAAIIDCGQIGRFRTDIRKEFPLATGRTVDLIVRPESGRLFIEAEVAKQSAENMMQVEVEEIVLSGSVRRHHLRAADGSAFVTTHLTSGDKGWLKPGEPAFVAWAARHCFAIPR